MTTNSISVNSSTSFLQDFAQKITLVPNDVNRFLRSIRFLDKRLEKLQKILTKEQRQILQKINLLKDKDKKSLSTAMETVMKETNNFTQLTNKKIVSPGNLPLPLQEIFNEYINILHMERQVIGYARQKTAIGGQLSSQVRQYFQILQKQVRVKILRQLRPQQTSVQLQQMPIQDLINYIKKKKQMSLISTNPALRKKQDFMYDPKQDKFCYCGQASYGDMVFCQNLYCQREWFHLTCIKQSNLPEKWFCNQCQKMKDKTKNSISRSYFSIAS